MKILISSILFCTLLLGACGKKGDLTLPKATADQRSTHTPKE